MLRISVESGYQAGAGSLLAGDLWLLRIPTVMRQDPLMSRNPGPRGRDENRGADPGAPFAP